MRVFGRSNEVKRSQSVTLLMEKTNRLWLLNGLTSAVACKLDKGQDQKQKKPAKL
jgi:hypothetical protein